MADAPAIIINLPGYPFQNLQSVSSLAALRGVSSLALVNGQDVTVDYGTTVEDGLGGVFYWNDGSVTTDDNSTAIKPTDLTSLQAGRWIMSSGSSAVIAKSSSLTFTQAKIQFFAAATSISRVKLTGYSIAGVGAADYIYDAAVDSAFVTTYPRAAFLAADGRGFRLDPSQGLWVEQFGAVGDGTTDCTAAFRAAIAYATRFGNTIFPQIRGVNTINLGLGTFDVYGALPLRASVTFIGRGHGMEFGQDATVLRQRSATDLFQLDRYNSSIGSPSSSTTTGADGSEFSGISMRYAGPVVTKGQNAPCAIRSRVRVNLHDFTVETWPGPGLEIVANSGAGDATEGEASGSSIRRVAFLANWAGALIDGADSNVHNFTDCTFGYSSTFGMIARQFLGCNWTNCHFKENGIPNLIGYAGKRWALMPDQQALGGTTTPGTNASVWQEVDANVGTTPAWASGGSYTPGGAVMHVNRNARSLFDGCYFESGQGAPVVMFPAASVGGQWGHAAGADGVHLNFEQGQLQGRSFRTGPAGAGVVMDPTTGLGFEDVGFRVQRSGGDVRATRNNLDAYESWRVTCGATTRDFGTGAPVPDVFTVSRMGFGNRLWTIGTAPPTTGFHAVGEIVWDPVPVPGGNIGRVCVTAGTPGVWKSFGAIAA